ncbi:Peptidase M20 domain-containing protein 2 [Metarhizium brunneum]|uniref:Peptidase M20 domain-containing protein 2 n=1 Tax=Metarhizium brunneum TaxID=500148 RepID=A0A7D5YYI4_9HYPO
MSPVTVDTVTQARAIVNARLDELDDGLHQVNRTLHANPELAYKEFIAHDTITAYLEKLGFQVERSAWGLATSFDATVGSGDRQVIFCAEYDALPEIGHACGHNLIAISSIGAFLGAAAAMSALKIDGRIRLLGTPAEESGGGKQDLVEAGAFNPPESVVAAIMAHPMPIEYVSQGGFSGLAGMKLIACQGTLVEFKGRTAHAAGEPWKGVNALDGAVAAYNNVSLLRQQMHTEDRVHGVFEVGGTAPNVIPDYTRMNWIVRSPTAAGCDKLMERVTKCWEAGASASACEMKTTRFVRSPFLLLPSCSYLLEGAKKKLLTLDIPNRQHHYLNLRANDSLCQIYVDEMAAFGQNIHLKIDRALNASTDMGNVSHFVPSFHGGIGIPAEPGVAMHNPRFAAAAGTDEAHGAAIQAAKGMAMLGLRVLLDSKVAAQARLDFERDDEEAHL